MRTFTIELLKVILSFFKALVGFIVLVALICSGNTPD